MEIGTRTEAYQAKRTQDGQALDSLETQLQEREGHNDEVEDVPALLEVVLGAHGHQLHGGLDGEGGREELQVKVGHGYDCSWGEASTKPILT